jgi:hypothetical protein
LYFQPLLASQKALLASNKSFEASTQTISLENELPQRPKVNLNKRFEPKNKGHWCGCKRKKKVDLSFSEQLLRVFFSTFCRKKK